jgi:hypothetical protein
MPPDYRYPTPLQGGYDSSTIMPDPYQMQKWECVRPIYMEHLNRYMTAKFAKDKFMELEALVTIGITFIANAKEREKIRNKLMGRGAGDSTGGITKASKFLETHRDHFEAHISWDVILEAEYSELLPGMRDVFFDVQRCLVEAGFLQWVGRDPVAELKGEIIDKAITEMRSGSAPDLSPPPITDQGGMFNLDPHVPPIDESKIVDLDAIESAEMGIGMGKPSLAPPSDTRGAIFVPPLVEPPLKPSKEKSTERREPDAPDDD